MLVLPSWSTHHTGRPSQHGVIAHSHLATDSVCLASELFSVGVLIALCVYVERLLETLVGLVVIRQYVLQFFLLYLLLVMRDWLQHPNCLILGSSQIHQDWCVRLIVTTAVFILQPTASLTTCTTCDRTLFGSPD